MHLFSFEGPCIPEKIVVIKATQHKQKLAVLKDYFKIGVENTSNIKVSSLWYNILCLLVYMGTVKTKRAECMAP